MDIPEPPKSGTARRGFASMTPERRSEAARKGGASVPNEKRTFARDVELAREAGRRGGEMKQRNRKGDA